MREGFEVHGGEMQGIEGEGAERFCGRDFEGEGLEVQGTRSKTSPKRRRVTLRAISKARAWAAQARPTREPP